MPIPPSLYRTLIARPPPVGGSAGPLDYLAGTFQLRDGSPSGPPSTLWTHDATRLKVLDTALTAFREGTHDAGTIAVMRDELRQLVETSTGCFSCSLGANRDQEIVLSCEGDIRLLTDLPWEMLPLATIPGGARINDVVEDSLANRPFVRGVNAQSTAPAKRATGRLRILPCIVNPPLPDGAAGYPPIEITKFAKIIDEALRQFRQIEVVGDPMVTTSVTSNALSLQIKHLRPHLLLIVAHGSSAGTAPELIFADGPLSIRSLAAWLRRAPEVIAGFLISCDTARTPTSMAPAAAMTLVDEAGLSEVVVMQGKIQQNFAQLFLREFLTSLMVQRSLAMATSDGRLAMKAGPQAFFPTIFRNLASPPNESTIGGIIAQYEASLREVAADLAPSSSEILISRKRLSQRLASQLKSNGLLLISGPPGSGKTTLLKTTLAVFAGTGVPAGRPAIYVDCSGPETGPFFSNKVEELLAKIARRVNSITQSFGNLLPEAATANFTGVTIENALRTIDGWQAILILDEVQIPSNPADKTAWNLFLQRAATLTRSLIVTTEQTSSRDGILTLDVPYLSLPETRKYATLNQLTEVDRLHTYTGGALLLLNAVRDLNQVDRPVDLERPGLFSASEVGRVYARTMKSALSRSELSLFARLLWLEDAVEEQLLRTYVFFDAEAAVVRFRALGLLVVAPSDDRILLTVPGFVRAMIQVGAIARHASALALRARLFDQPDPERFVRELFDRPSGPVMVVAFQRAVLHLGDQALAESLAFSAFNSRHGTTRALHRLFLTAHQAAPRTAAPGISIAALRLSAELGYPTMQLERDIFRRRDLSSFDRARFLLARATAWKDRKQASARKAILADLNFVIAQSLFHTVRGRFESGNRQDWDGLRAGALTKRIHERLFLENRPPRDVAADLAQLREIVGPGEQFGNAVASLVERELKVTPAPDWTQILVWLTECDSYLAKSQNHRYLGYFHYQRGQYFRRKPDPQLQEALRWYRQSEEEERIAGEPRRSALALYRRLEIHWQQREGKKGNHGLDEIREAVAQLDTKGEDSLTLRVLQRLFVLQADIELGASQGPGTGALEAACAIGSSAHLTGQDDVFRFQTALHRCLSLYLERSTMRAAADFLNRFIDPIFHKLNLRLSVANLEAARQALSPTTKA